MSTQHLADLPAWTLTDGLNALGQTYSGETPVEESDHGTVAIYFLMVYFKVKRMVQTSI
jgi:hypothetical protein